MEEESGRVLEEGLQKIRLHAIDWIVRSNKRGTVVFERTIGLDADCWGRRNWKMIEDRWSFLRPFFSSLSPRQTCTDRCLRTFIGSGRAGGPHGSAHKTELPEPAVFFVWW